MCLIKFRMTTKLQADKLYDQYVRPLEKSHQGQFVAVSPKGQLLFGSTLLEVLYQATLKFGKGNFIFKVGDKIVGKLR
jgi:hypothetical protein